MEFDSTSKATPVKDRQGSQSRIGDRTSENLNPNVSRSSPAKSPLLKSAKSPLVKSAKSPLVKSAKSRKSASRNPAPYSPPKKIRERKFVVAKKNSRKENQAAIPAVDCKCGAKEKRNTRKCHCVAFEILRASQEEFFKKRDDEADAVRLSEVDKACSAHEYEDGGDRLDDQDPDEAENKKKGENLLEEARCSLPEFGKVKHLVEAFENFRLIPKTKDSEVEGKNHTEGCSERAMKWELPGLQQKAHEPAKQEVSSLSSTLCPDLQLTAENLGLQPQASVTSSWESTRSSVSSRTSKGGSRSRRNSLESCGGTRRMRQAKKQQHRITSAKPFNLRTELRGRMKEEEFMKKLQEMIMEEEKMRIPIAQGLPWTTDEPECLIKPPVKDSTTPVDLKLHTDIRAVERAMFDHQVAERMSIIEQYKMERERQLKLAEEEEIRRLRKELIPKAQPMPYFDRPFVPLRSMKNPTMPREPRFHIPDNKRMKCCSWSDASSTTSSCL